MLCGLTIPELGKIKKAKRLTLTSGVTILDCPLFAGGLDSAPWHDRHHCKEILDACVARVHDACVPGTLTQTKWNTMCSRLVVCLVGHPFEHQDRDPDGPDVPVCLDGLVNPVVRKIPTCDRYGEPTKAELLFTRLIIRRACQVGPGDPTDGEIEAIRAVVLPLVRQDVKAIQDDQDAQSAKREWCYGMLHNQTVRDWLTANPPPQGWSGLVVQDGPPGGPYVDVPMGWAYTNRADIFPSPLGG